MFSDAVELDLRKTLFYMTKIHGYQPSELLNMSYIDFRITVSLLEAFLVEESQRNAMLEQGF